MTQNGVEFFVDGLVTADPGRFTVIGRCGDEPIRLDDRFTAVIRYKPRRYPDEIGQAPVRMAEEAACLRVICIHAYDRSLPMLGQGMTGSLVVEGEGLQHVAPGSALGTASRDASLDESAPEPFGAGLVTTPPRRGRSRKIEVD